MKTVSAAEANRDFSRLLRRAGAGETVIITSRGRPVAQIGPVEPDLASREAAHAALLRRWETTTPVVAPWRREDLYEDDDAT
jgi:prevent-host-death family protein